MPSLFEKLPSILILAVLVGIFVALRRHVKSIRLNLWTAAWILIFLHFFVGIFEPHANHNIDNLLYAIDRSALLVSAMLFVVSLTSFVEQRSSVWMLLALTALPVFIYTAAYAFDDSGWSFRPVYL